MGNLGTTFALCSIKNIDALDLQNEDRVNCNQKTVCFPWWPTKEWRRQAHKRKSLVSQSYPVTLVNEKSLPKKEDVGEGETIKKTNMNLKGIQTWASD